MDKIYICASKQKIIDHNEFIENLKAKYQVESIDDLKPSGGEKTIVTLGGDGTLNYLVNSVKDFKNVKVIYFPCGTANDFTKSFRINPVVPNISNLESILTNSSTITIPIMNCNDRRFLNVATGGSPARVTDSGSELLKTYIGKASYYLNALEEVISPDSSRIELILDGNNSISSSLLGFAILQGLHAGGGVKLSPNITANFKDTFEFVGIESNHFSLGMSELIKMQVQDDLHTVNKENFIHHVVKKIIIKSNQSISVKLDGEEYSSKQLEFTKHQNTIEFYYY